MKQIPETYRTLRRNLTVPAAHALHNARAEGRFRARIAELGFAWQRDKHYNQFASWTEAGFDLRARLVSDDDGWWTAGVNTLGKFTNHREPGAIRHHKAGRNEYPWFVPANPEYGREDYRRACAYGRDWWYVGVVVTASRAGVKLGEFALWGIDYEPGANDDYLTEVALDSHSRSQPQAPRALRLPLRAKP
jgi:hypothetical protein